MIKGIKVLNAVSVFLFAAILLLVYAYLPIAVDTNIHWVGEMHKQTFFYYALGTFLLVNLLLRVSLSAIQSSVSEELQAWFQVVVFIVNFYLVTLIGFIGVINNTNHIHPDSFAYLNYLGPILLVVWLARLIFLVINQKK